MHPATNRLTRSAAKRERKRIAAWLRDIAPKFWNGQRDCDPENLAECLEANDLTDTGIVGFWEKDWEKDR